MTAIAEKTCRWPKANSTSEGKVSAAVGERVVVKKAKREGKK